MKTSSRAMGLMFCWCAVGTGSSSKVTILSLERMLEDLSADGGRGGSTSMDKLNSLTLRGTKYSTAGVCC